MCLTTGSQPETRLSRHVLWGRIDPATSKPLEESIYVKKKTPDKKNLLHQISVYTKSRKGLVGTEVLKLLRDVDAHLREATGTTNATTVIDDKMEATTKSIQKSL